MRAIMFGGAMLVLLSGPALAQAQQDLFDPVQHYRLAHYRGVVGAAPEGVQRIDALEVRRLQLGGAILIDVNPAEGGVRDAGSGKWALAMPHRSIPRAHWFPETGRGKLADGIEQWFIDGARRLQRAHPSWPVVIFCQADCWMSWNAALRLRRAGVTNLRWFADGLDGWKEAGFRIEDSIPDGGL